MKYLTYIFIAGLILLVVGCSGGAEIVGPVTTTAPVATPTASPTAVPTTTEPAYTPTELPTEVPMAVPAETDDSTTSSPMEIDESNNAKAFIELRRRYESALSEAALACGQKTLAAKR